MLQMAMRPSSGGCGRTVGPARGAVISATAESLPRPTTECFARPRRELDGCRAEAWQACGGRGSRPFARRVQLGGDCLVREAIGDQAENVELACAQPAAESGAGGDAPNASAIASSIPREPSVQMGRRRPRRCLACGGDPLELLAEKRGKVPPTLSRIADAAATTLCPAGIAGRGHVGLADQRARQQRRIAVAAEAVDGKAVVRGRQLRIAAGRGDRGAQIEGACPGPMGSPRRSGPRALPRAAVSRAPDRPSCRSGRARRSRGPRRADCALRDAVREPPRADRAPVRRPRRACP